MKKFSERTSSFFKDNDSAIAAQDWKQLRPMTLIYAAAIALYYFVVCLYENNPDQSAAVIAALVLQLIYSAAVFLRKHRPEMRSGVSIYLRIFALNIMAISIYLGDFVFKNEYAWLFPIMLILVTQIYSLPPGEMFSGLALFTVVFLFFSWFNKPENIFFIDIVASLIAFSVASVSYFTILKYKIENFEKERELEHLCSTDMMTGLLNKTSFIGLYESESGSIAAGEAGYLAVADIDSFKAINDKLGHLAGDDVLCFFAGLCQKHLGGSGYVASGRFGGDEFVTYMRSSAGSDSIIKRFQLVCSEFCRTMTEKYGFDITCSIGIAAVSCSKTPFDDVFLSADRELYRIKKSGGGRVGFSAAGM